MCINIYLNLKDNNFHLCASYILQDLNLHTYIVHKNIHIQWENSNLQIVK